MSIFQPSAFISDIIDSMELYPEEWRVEKYSAIHKSGIDICLINFEIERPFRYNLWFANNLAIRKAIKRLKQLKCSKMIKTCTA